MLGTDHSLSCNSLDRPVNVCVFVRPSVRPLEIFIKFYDLKITHYALRSLGLLYLAEQGFSSQFWNQVLEITGLEDRAPSAQSF